MTQQGTFITVKGYTRQTTGKHKSWPTYILPLFHKGFDYQTERISFIEGLWYAGPILLL